MSESTNGDLKVILTHLDYIRGDIAEVKQLLANDNARLNDLENGRSAMLETINSIKSEHKIFSSITSGIAAFLAAAFALLMKKI